MNSTIESLERKIVAKKRTLADYQENMVSDVAQGRFRQVSAMAIEAYALVAVIEQLEYTLAQLKA